MMTEINYEEAYKELKKELQWIHDLMRNGTIDPRDKVVLYETRFQVLHSESDDKGLFHIPVWNIAEKTGISSDRVGKSLIFLADNGIIEREGRRITNSNGGAENATFVALTDKALDPKRIQLSDNGHGGRRKKKPKLLCPHCGGEHLVDKNTRECTSCGGVLSESHTFVNEIEQTATEPIHVELARYSYGIFVQDGGSIDYVEPLDEFIINYPADWTDIQKQKFSDHVYGHRSIFLQFLEEDQN